VSAAAPLVRLPPLTEAQTEVWHLLFDLAQEQDSTWCLIGGLMVFLYGVEHQQQPRPTDDADIVVDIQANPAALGEIVRFIKGRGLEPELAPEGIQHRFKRESHGAEVVIDVMAPDHSGVRADLTTTPPGRTLEVPGGRRALARATPVWVTVGSRTGRLLRPDELGAIVVKLGAIGTPGDPGKHYEDLAFLLSILTDPLDARASLSTNERSKLRTIGLHDPGHRAWRLLRAGDATRGQAALRLLTSASSQPG
jgi:hypothetical protein